MGTTKTASDLEAVQRVLEVQRATVSGLTPDGTWPCPTCSDEYGVHECWKVTYLDEEPQPRAVIVCQTCAEHARARLA